MMKGWLKYLFRPYVVKGARWFFPAPLAKQFSNLAALSRLSRWLKDHPCRNDQQDRYALYDFLVKTEHLDSPIDFLEFGVCRGRSLKWWCQNIACADARFVGFDCFRGLPEDWGSTPAGTFDTKGCVPEIDDNRVSFVVGLYQDTVHRFMEEYSSDRRKVIHLDSDLYSSTLFVLAKLASHLRPRDILIFDDFGSIRMAQHEFRAFEDFCGAFRVSVKSLAATSLLETAAVMVL